MVISPTLRHLAATMLAKKVAENIKRLRKARGWSLERVAAACKPPTSYQQISRLEKGPDDKDGRTVDFDWVERIAPAFGLTPIELIAGEVVQAPPQQAAFTLDGQVANEAARTLAQMALQGAEPPPGIVEALALALLDLHATFSVHPRAAADPEIARPVLALVSRRYAPSTN